MPSQSAKIVLIGALAVSAIIPVVPAGCARRQPEDASTIEKHAYTVRGQIVALPSGDGPVREIQVRHEAIPHFRAGGGKLGMNTMVMPFPLVEGLLTSGLREGQKITLHFEVDFDTAADTLTGYRATGIELLPEDTALDWTPLTATGAEKKPGDQTN